MNDVAPKSSRPALLVALLAGAAAGVLGARLASHRPLGPDPAALRPGAADSADDSPVVARVGDDVVTLAEFDQRWRQLDGAAKSFHGEQAREQGLASAREHFLSELVDEMLLAREAERRGFDRRPDVQAAVRAVRRRMAARPLLAEEVRGAAVPRSEVEAWYRAHADRFGTPERVRVREIAVTSSVSGPADDTPDADAARAKAEGLRVRLAAGEDFATVAAQASEAPSAQYGGLVGWLVTGRFARAWEEKAMALQPGDVTDVFEVPEGFAILTVVEREASTIPPLDEVEDRIIEELLQDDRGALQRRYSVFLAKLRQENPPESHPELVRQDAPLAERPDAPAATP